MKDVWLASAAEMRRMMMVYKANVASDVADARRSGASWAEVGRALGMSAQGAQQQFDPVKRGRKGSLTSPGESAGTLQDHD